MSGELEQRIDHDAPTSDQAYVIRIESTGGWRLKTTASPSEVGGRSARERMHVLVSKAISLIDLFSAHEIERGEPHVTEDDRYWLANSMFTWTGDDDE